MVCTPHWNIVITLQLRYIARATHWHYVVHCDYSEIAIHCRRRTGKTLCEFYLRRETHYVNNNDWIRATRVLGTGNMHLSGIFGEEGWRDTHTHRFLFLSSFPFKLRVITLQFRYTPIGTCCRIICNYTVITLQLWDLARTPHWRCTVITLQLHCNCDTLHALHTVITLQLHCNCDTLHALHSEATLQLHCNCDTLHALHTVIALLNSSHGLPGEF